MNTNRIQRVHRIPQGVDQQGRLKPGRQHYTPDDCRPTPGWTLVGLAVTIAAFLAAVAIITAVVRWLSAGPDELAVGQQQHLQAQQLDAEDRKSRRIDDIIARHHANIAEEGGAK